MNTTNTTQYRAPNFAGAYKTIHGEIFAADGTSIHVNNVGATIRACSKQPIFNRLTHAGRVAAIRAICAQRSAQPVQRGYCPVFERN